MNVAGRLTKVETIEGLRAAKRTDLRWLERYERAVMKGIYEHFGSLVAARRAAGLPEPARGTWSIERIVNELRAERRAGVAITSGALTAAGRGDLVGAIDSHIGSIVQARRLARIPDPPRPLPVNDPEPRGTWDEDALIGEIRACARRGESLAASKVAGKIVSSARAYFGSWRAAVEAAGFDYRATRLVREPYSEQEICAELLRLRRTYPHMTMNELYEQRIASSAVRRFGSIADALAAAGIIKWPSRKKRQWTRAELLATLLERAKRGLPLDKTLRAAVRTYFGNVRAARALLGLPNVREAWSKELIVEKLRSLAAHGAEVDRALRGACVRHFGGLVAARTAAGLGPTVPAASYSRSGKASRRLARRRQGQLRPGSHSS